MFAQKRTKAAGISYFWQQVTIIFSTILIVGVVLSIGLTKNSVFWTGFSALLLLRLLPLLSFWPGK
jgi:hypothetical protein